MICDVAGSSTATVQEGQKRAARLTHKPSRLRIAVCNKFVIMRACGFITKIVPY
jgi:hypothetical protein